MVRRPWMALATLALVSFVGSCARGVACAPTAVVRARTEGHGPASLAPMNHRHHHRSEREAPDHVAVRCPLAVDDPGLVLATVGDATITACDVAIVREQRLRAGLGADDARAMLRGLVDDALLAAEAEAMPPRVEPAVARALADALIRDEARTALAARRPTERELDRWLEEHPESRMREARVHLRQLVFATLPEAREAIAALRAGAAFEDLLPRSIDPLAQRDGGDLGLLTSEGATGVLPGVVTIGFALTEPFAVADDPVQGAVTRGASRGRGGRRGRGASSRWHVVQLLERVPEARIDDDAVRQRASDRIVRDRYAHARAATRARLAEQFAPQVRAAINHMAALGVRVLPP
jgi:hypothetical protein